MCGRYRLNLKWRELVALYKIRAEPAWNGTPRCSPTDLVLVLVPAKAVRLMRWGWPSARYENPWRSPPIINAKSEGIATNPFWSEAFASRRCLLPAEGFWEWENAGGQKLPHFFRPLRTTALAGLWSRFDAEDGPVNCVVILTCEANAMVTPIHARMPVILGEEAWASWLDTENPDPAALLRPFPPGEMRDESRQIRLFGHQNG